GDVLREALRTAPLGAVPGLLAAQVGGLGPVALRGHFAHRLDQRLPDAYVGQDELRHGGSLAARVVREDAGHERTPRPAPGPRAGAARSHRAPAQLALPPGVPAGRRRA